MKAGLSAFVWQRPGTPKGSPPLPGTQCFPPGWGWESQFFSFFHFSIILNFLIFLSFLSFPNFSQSNVCSRCEGGGVKTKQVTFEKIASSAPYEAIWREDKGGVFSGNGLGLIFFHVHILFLVFSIVFQLSVIVLQFRDSKLGSSVRRRVKNTTDEFKTNTEKTSIPAHGEIWSELFFLAEAWDYFLFHALSFKYVYYIHIVCYIYAVFLLSFKCSICFTLFQVFMCSDVCFRVCFFNVYLDVVPTAFNC